MMSPQPDAKNMPRVAPAETSLAHALIGGMSIEAFDHDIREQSYRRFEAAFSAASLANLFGLERLERVLREAALLPHVDVYAEGHLKRLTDMQRKSGQTALDVSLRCFRDGQTLRVRDVERFDQTLGRFVADVERLLSCTAQANVYLTPPSRDGFPPHFDITDVFVVQVHGEKEWTIYEDYANRVELPLPATDWNPDRYTPLGIAETLTLRPGDVLYLPRGTMHAAACGARESLHLTIAIELITYAGVLRRAADMAANANVELRRRVPLTGRTTDAELQALADAARKVVLAELARADFLTLLHEERGILTETASEHTADEGTGFARAIAAQRE